jgi:RelA/SpoT family (p)ppGpp synthetase
MTVTAPITLRQLLESLPDGPSGNGASALTRAYEFADEAHAGRRRESGELYIEHDLAVANIICDLGMDQASITACILHDSLHPHTGKDEAMMSERFGSEVTSLVTGLERLKPYMDKHELDRDDRTLEAIRRAILTVIDGDPRIIVIQLADRLQDLRKAGELSPERQAQIALEARDIHVPLANRLGIWQFKWELEDLSFRYLEPEQYKRIARMISGARARRKTHIESAVQALSERLSQAKIEAEVTGRPKHVYAIYRKMQEKSLSFEQMYDITALRVIIEKDDPNQCYVVLGIVHNLWTPLPNEFDDYIARAKPNGYQSLHTAVVDEMGRTLEVQIRTRTMHEEAEKGIAAHWAYKESASRHTSTLYDHLNWLRQALIDGPQAADISQEGESDAVKTELLSDRVYAFTPRGDVIDLPEGSTPIDFAYAIHTEVGHRCRGARVNGKMVSLDYQLRSGDQVEIITANKGGPSRDWMNESLGYTGSARTRSKVRGWFRQQEREKNVEQGRSVVNRELKRLGVAELFSVRELAETLGYDDTEQFLAKVGFGDIQSSQIAGAIAKTRQKLRPDDELRALLEGERPKRAELTVRGVSGLPTKIARCCNPIPPEPIVGYTTRGRGITIHHRDCKQLFATKEPERWIEVEWGDEDAFPIPIIVRGYRRPGLMEDISNILRGQHVNVSKTKTTTANSVTTIYLVVDVANLEQLNWILSRLGSLKNVTEVRRERWQ